MCKSGEEKKGEGTDDDGGNDDAPTAKHASPAGSDGQ